jgi:hypothetical protein
MENKKNLAVAIIKVMQAVKGIEKNTTVGSGSYGYKGVTDKDVKHAFNEAMATAGLCILPIDIDETTDLNRTEANGKQKLQVFTKVVTRYLLLHESGESQVITGYGHGIDNGDKASGKATTYALKNALLYAFLTPTGTIDDADNTHSNDLQQAPTPQKPAKVIEGLPAVELPDNQKTWLNDVGDDFKEALRIIAKGGTINDLRRKYKISKAVGQKLTNK